MFIQGRLDALKINALNKLTVYLAVSLFFLFLAFLHRLSNADWQNVYLLHFACFGIGTLVIAINKRLSYKTTVFWYLGLGLSLAASEFISVGLNGMGDIASLYCIMLALFYLDRRSTVVVGLMIIVIFSLTLHQYVYTGRSLSASDMTYLSWPSSWIGTFVACAGFFAIIGMSIYHLQNQTVRLLVKTEYQKKIIEEQKIFIEHLANHDALTGLPSLRAADDCLEAALTMAAQKQHQSALLFLDLDGFKSINDNHGHQAGDEVLKRVADRIASVIRTGDTACRVGGDEFLVIVEKVKDLSDIESLCQRLIKTISTPFIYNDTELAVGVSIGAACYPDSANSPRELRLKADEMMYLVKQSGKNNYRIL